MESSISSDFNHESVLSRLTERRRLRDLRVKLTQYTGEAAAQKLAVGGIPLQDMNPLLSEVAKLSDYPNGQKCRLYDWERAKQQTRQHGRNTTLSRAAAKAPLAIGLYAQSETPAWNDRATLVKLSIDAIHFQSEDVAEWETQAGSQFNIGRKDSHPSDTTPIESLPLVDRGFAGEELGAESDALLGDNSRHSSKNSSGQIELACESSWNGGERDSAGIALGEQSSATQQI